MRVRAFGVSVVLGLIPVFCAVGGTGFFRLDVAEGGKASLRDGEGRTFFMRGVDHVQFKGHWCAALKKFPHLEWNKAHYESEEAWRVETIGRLKKWGFNTLTGVPDDALLHRGLAHTVTLDFGKRVYRTDWQNDPDLAIKSGSSPCTYFPNVFATGFVTRCEALSATLCKSLRNDRTLVGYFLDNELAWWGNAVGKDRAGAAGMFDAVAALPPEHSARQALDAFRAARPAGESLATTKEKFLELVAERYFSICTGAVRRHDPNHLILGCRFAGFGGANKIVWEVAGRHCDVVSFNCYPHRDWKTGRLLEKRGGRPLADVFDEYQAVAKRPFLVTEWSVVGLDAGLPCKHGAGQRTSTQAERARIAEAFARFFMSRPYVVGYDWFMWVDEPALAVNIGGEDSNYGLVNEKSEPYRALVGMFTRLHREGKYVTTTPKSCIGMTRSWDPYPGWWEKRHAEKLAQIAASGGKIDIVFIGDSITHNWEGARGPGSDYGGKPLAELKKKYSVLNLGFGGDGTQNVLWRLLNGELDGYAAKCIVLMIGTNNGGKPDETAAGIEDILDLIAAKQPQAKVVLHPIFPSGATADHPWRVRNAKVNALIKPFADGRRVIWCDFNARFLNPDGTLKKELMMPDNLHPAPPAYGIWAKELGPIFNQL